MNAEQLPSEPHLRIQSLLNEAEKVVEAHPEYAQAIATIAIGWGAYSEAVDRSSGFKPYGPS